MSRSPFWSDWTSLWLQKFAESLEITVTYFMTIKVTVSFLVDLTSMTCIWPQKVTVSIGRCDLLFDPQRTRGPFWSVWPRLWPQKVRRSLEVTVTYFMTPKVTGGFFGRFDLVYDPKGDRVVRGRRDLLYNPKGHGDLFGRFDLDHDPKRSQGH